MFRLSYQERNDQASLKAFSQLIEINNSNSKINISNELGTGTIEIITIEEGLFARIWDCSFKKKIELHRRASRKHEELQFALSYFINPEAFILKNPMDPEMRLNRLWNTLFASSKIDFKFDIIPGVPVRCITICFSRNWIEKHTTVMPSKQREFIYEIMFNPQPVFYFENLNTIESKMIRNIFEDQRMKKIASLFLKARVMTLINEFIAKSSERRPMDPFHKIMYESAVQQVEKKLLTSFDSGMPSIKDLSREFCLSESTLKRNFKEIYGKSIRDYYLEKKMMHAKELIIQKEKTVTEIAYMMGYEKVSQFIAMFKKQNGCLPGMLRRGIA